jgi:hypothetical protein
MCILYEVIMIGLIMNRGEDRHVSFIYINSTVILYLYLQISSFKLLSSLLSCNFKNSKSKHLAPSYYRDIH